MDTYEHLTPGRFMLGQIKTIEDPYHEACEALGGFRNERWHDLLFGCGETRIKDSDDILVNGVPLPRFGIDLHLERLAHYDLDWQNALLAQTWNHAEQATADWHFVLLLNSGANQWVPEPIYAWGNRRPSFAEAGHVLDYVLRLPGNA